MDQVVEQPKKRHGCLKWLGMGVVLVVLILTGGYFFEPYEAQKVVSPIGAKQTNCQPALTSNYTKPPYYQGELYDAHFHMPVAPGIKTPLIKQPKLGEGKDITLNQILCLFDKQKTTGALAFFMPQKKMRATIPQAKEIKNYTNRFQLFLQPAAISVKDLNNILDQNPGMFIGIGEIQFYELTKYIRPIDGKWMKGVIASAKKHNLPVMFHPGDNQAKQTEAILRDNPDVTFILHGHEMEQEIDQLMDAYPNLYYSVDGATLYALRGMMVRSSRDDYMREFKQEFVSLLDERISYWRDIIGRHPDRFMWGTDRGGVWHFDSEFNDMSQEFARAFIARLDPAVQELFAHKNVEKLLGI